MVQENIQTLVKVTVNSREFGRSKTQENTEGLACSLSTLTSALLYPSFGLCTSEVLGISCFIQL